MKNLEYRNEIAKKLNIGTEMLYLSMDDCKATGITEEEIIALTEKAMAAYSKREVEMPAKIGIHPQPDSLMHAMPCYIPSEKACGIKWGSNYPTNKERFPELVPTNCQVIYNDCESGMPLAIMDAYWITEVRTPAVSFVGAKYCANLDCTTFGMVGCGIQGRAHVKMAEKVLTKLEKIYIFDIYESAMDKLIADIQPLINAKIIKAKSYEEIAKSSETIATSIPIAHKPNPVIKDEWIFRGQTLLLTDCHSAFEDATMKRADKYFFDSIEQHTLLEEYGYYPKGLPVITGETGELAAGLKKGRENKDELIVSNNVGMAVEDIMVARSIFDRALEQGIGIKLPIWARTTK